MTRPESGPAVADRATPGAAEWVALALVCGSGVLSGVLEVLYVGQFYVGTTVVPVVVLAAVLGNILLPRWGFRAVSRAAGAVLPVACWLVPVLVLSTYSRPEGDVLVIAEFQQQWVFYGVLLGGSIAGFVTIFVLTGRRVAPPPQPRPGGRPGPKGRSVSR